MNSMEQTVRNAFVANGIDEQTANTIGSAESILLAAARRWDQVGSGLSEAELTGDALAFVDAAAACKDARLAKDPDSKSHAMVCAYACKAIADLRAPHAVKLNPGRTSGQSHGQVVG